MLRRRRCHGRSGNRSCCFRGGCAAIVARAVAIATVLLLIVMISEAVEAAENACVGAIVVVVAIRINRKEAIVDEGACVCVWVRALLLQSAMAPGVGVLAVPMLPSPFLMLFLRSSRRRRRLLFFL